MGTVADEWQWLEYVSVIALWVFIACGLGLVLAPMARAIVRGQRLIMEEPTPEGRDHPQERPAPLAIEAAPHQQFRVPPYVGGEYDPDNTAPLKPWERPRKPADYQSSGDKHTPPRRLW